MPTLLIILLSTVSQICSWISVSSIVTALELKSTPTVTLYSLEKFYLTNFCINAVLPTTIDIFYVVHDSPMTTTLNDMFADY